MPKSIGKKEGFWTSVSSITCWAMDWPTSTSTTGSGWIHYVTDQDLCNTYRLWCDNWSWIWSLWPRIWRYFSLGSTLISRKSSSTRSHLPSSSWDSHLWAWYWSAFIIDTCIFGPGLSWITPSKSKTDIGNVYYCQTCIYVVRKKSRKSRESLFTF